MYAWLDQHPPLGYQPPPAILLADRNFCHCVLHTGIKAGILPISQQILSNFMRSLDQPQRERILEVDAIIGVKDSDDNHHEVDDSQYPKQQDTD